MKHKTFEEYLQEKFVEDYHGTKDGFEAAYDRWISGLEGEDYIQYANEAVELAAATAYEQGKKDRV